MAAIFGAATGALAILLLKMIALNLTRTDESKTERAVKMSGQTYQFTLIVTFLIAAPLLFEVVSTGI